jgi:hypothetical protein
MNIIDNNVKDIVNNNMNFNMNNCMNMMNMKNVSIKFRFISENFYSKYLKFPDLTIECSENDLVSSIIDKFIQKTNINIDLKYKKKIFLNDKESDLNLEKSVREELYDGFDYKEIIVSFPDNEIKNLKIIDDNIRNEVYDIFFRYAINETVYVYKNRKAEFVSSLKKKLSKLSFITDEFFSKLFDKQDKISKIIEYFKRSSYNYNESNKYYLNRKEINENLTIEEAGIKSDTKIIVCDDNNDYNQVFFKDNYGRTFPINYKPFELMSELFERYRNKSNNFNKNTRFIYNAQFLNDNSTAEFLKSPAIIRVSC